MTSFNGLSHHPDQGGATTQTYTIPSSMRNTYETGQTTSTIPLQGFSPPPKGFFANAGASGDDLPPASSPSMVPNRGRRRESLTGQMRRKVSETTSAAGGGASAFGLSRSPSGVAGLAGGQPIPKASRIGSPQSIRGFSTSPSFGAADLSTSFGAAAEALSLSSSMASNTTIGAHAHSPHIGTPVKQERSMGHSHFGKECFGPSGAETMSPSPSLLSSGAVGAMENDSRRHERRSSVSSTGTVNEDEERERSIAQSNQLLHKCESCAKVYRHPSCLVKHRWEHTVYWKEASKFLMSKHQQVQLLEAAAILVGMDSNARSLPEEKALWPAAVSPPSSGLLGSDQVNFEKLKAQKSRNLTPAPSSIAATSPGRGTTPSLIHNDSSDGSSSSNYDPSVRAGTLSPLHGMGQLRLNGNGAPGREESFSSSRRDSDIQKFRLDDGDTTASSERAERSGSAETEAEEDDDDLDERDATGRGLVGERYGMDAGGDVMAEMEMDDVQ
ncbi:hypothetical protein IE53DRAFT_367584 [Violaceomyces palustris]|uniref:Uncharacterized protein n=1 Tax=Violaceomyces palustris TaxID=1673888 RepID=A0ACD0P1P5_9BASI|nr:hypothetical protein IE53DRAFT_367584 [Violaceomyces palustris]